ncbi:MAG: fumarate hydratase [Methanobrevibacter sp.]|jgi:fumarate hydratase subunit alpha|nr:fumarate hydratase [Candidatus Methanovirga basalitermitum]
MISEKKVEDVIYKLFKKAVISLPKDVIKSIEDALEVEDNELSCLNLEAILKNINIAEEKGIPMCQDTGLPIIFVKLGNVKVENLYNGIISGLKKATKNVPLRPNIVDPITRLNTGDNTGVNIPLIDVKLIEENYIEFTVLPKGFGSENNNVLVMALPGIGVDGIKDLVVETIKKAGGKPCPPMIVGVGIGGTSDLALKLSKKALLSEIGVKNSDEVLAKLEEDILTEANKTDIGPMGLGGKTTVLDVKVLKAHTHTAGLPIGICIQCWAHRHATMRINDKN